ncbi:hypothetical protein HK096_007995, partial [Nowakowskiella sp. JEL0078]
WGGIGNESLKLPESVYLIGNCPHDWLFQHVAAVCHHGGAGTTAAGLKAGKPTIIVPFFGDQPFWGHMVSTYGVGPPPIPFKKLTSESLGAALTAVLSSEMQMKADKLAHLLAGEHGLMEGARSFHHHLPISNMVCDVLNGSDPWGPRAELARYMVPELGTKVSPAGLQVLKAQGKISNSTMVVPHFAVEWNIDLQGSVGKAVSSTAEEVKSWAQTAVSASTDTARGAMELICQPMKGIALAKEEYLVSGKMTSAAAGYVAKGMGNGIFKFVYFPTRATGKILDQASTSLHKLNAVINNKEYHRETSQPHIENAVDGIKEGFISAGKGIALGFSGLVTKPYKGAVRGGAFGAAKGFSQGVSGFLIKPLAGMVDLVGHSSKGIYQSIKHSSNNNSSSNLTDDPELSDNPVPAGAIFVEMKKNIMEVTIDSFNDESYLDAPPLPPRPPIQSEKSLPNLPSDAELPNYSER